MAVDYLPVMSEVTDCPVELTQWLASRFEVLNGKRVHIIKSADLPPQAQTVHAQCVIAWLWDIVPKDTQRIVFMSPDLVPLRALPELPDAAFAAATCGDAHLKLMASIYPLIYDTQRFFNAGFFVARRDTHEVFEHLKAFASNKAVKDPRGGGYLQTIFNLLVQSSMKPVWLPHDYSVSIATDPIEQIAGAIAANLCALAPTPKLVLMNMLRTTLGLNAYETRE